MLTSHDPSPAADGAINGECVVLDATATLPTASGIYAVFAGGGAPHLSWSVNLKRRLSRLLAGQYRGQINAVEYWPAVSRLEIFLLLYELTRSYYPADYRKRLRLRLPWFVSLRDRDPFPRIEVLNRLPRTSADVFAHFADRGLVEPPFFSHPYGQL